MAILVGPIMRRNADGSREELLSRSGVGYACLAPDDSTIVHDIEIGEGRGPATAGPADRATARSGMRRLARDRRLIRGLAGGGWVISVRFVLCTFLCAVLAVGCASSASSPASIGPSAAPTTVGSPTTPTPTPTPFPTLGVIRPEQLLPAGRYSETPFGPGGTGVCSGQAGCSETAADDTIRFTFTVPDGWNGGSVHSIYLADAGKAAPGGAGLIFSRGGGLYAEPCGDEPPPNIPVGPTVEDFSNALVDHPKLDVTTPVDVTLAGHSGKYVDLQVPSDISACPASYFPWEPGIYAQGPGSRWHLWVLDVDGVRVVVQSTDYEGTSPQRQAELRAIVESIQIDGTITSPSSAPSPS